MPNPKILAVIIFTFEKTLTENTFRESNQTERAIARKVRKKKSNGKLKERAVSENSYVTTLRNMPYGSRITFNITNSMKPTKHKSRNNNNRDTGKSEKPAA